MHDHANAELLRRLYSGGRDAFYGRLAPDYVAHIPGRNAAAGEYHGAAGHGEHVAAITRLSGGTLSKELSGTVLADDHWGLVPSVLTARRDVRTLAFQGFGIWRFSDGMVTDHWALLADQAAFDDLFR